MSNENLTDKKKHKRGHVTRMLERFGIISRQQAEEVQIEKGKSLNVVTDDILLEKGYATPEQIAAADKTPSDTNDLTEPTTGENAVIQFNKARDGLNDTITQGVKLADVAAAIAGKAK